MRGTYYSNETWKNQVIKDLENKLLSNKSLNIYLGIDPTSDKLHLGHLALISKLENFRKMGHNCFLLIGDFTAKIGDPTGRDNSRKIMSEEDVVKNGFIIKKTINDIFPELVVRFNSDWFKKMTLEQFLLLSNNFSISEIIQRNDFRDRLNNNISLGLQEVIYPILQAYDAAILKTDIQLGGHDQLLNISIGREFTKNNMIPLLFPLLPGIDGRKMSKTFNNTIDIEDSPFEQYCKLMRVDDKDVKSYLNLLLNETPNIKDIFSLKKEMAKQIVSMIHGEQDGYLASERWNKEISKKTDIEYIDVTNDDSVLVNIVAELHSCSKSEARRLINQGAVCVDKVKIMNPIEIINLNNYKISIGRHYFNVSKEK